MASFPIKPLGQDILHCDKYVIAHDEFTGETNILLVVNILSGQLRGIQDGPPLQVSSAKQIASKDP